MRYGVVRSEVLLCETGSVDSDGAGLEENLEETLHASNGSAGESGERALTYRDD